MQTLIKLKIFLCITLDKCSINNYIWNLKSKKIFKNLPNKKTQTKYELKNRTILKNRKQKHNIYKKNK